MSEAMLPARIIADLKQIQGEVPVAAIEAALAAPENVKEALLALLSEFARQPETLPFGAIAHWHAMLLLAQWRESRAFDSLSKFLELPAEMVDHVLGETLDTLLARALASTCHNRAKQLFQAVENPQNYDYCRIAALKALTILMLQGELARESLIEFYHDLMLKLPRLADAFPWDLLVREINEIHPAELEHPIRKLFADGLINPHFLRVEHMESALSQSPNQLLEATRRKPEYQIIKDALAEIRELAIYAGT